MPITHLLAQSVIMELERDPSDNLIEEEKLVLIDTDGGTDDAWALFLCLQAHRNPKIPFRLVAITGVHGNTSVDNATTNVTRVLKTVHELNIPVYRGSESALIHPWSVGKDPYHGLDGFGDAGLNPVQPEVEQEHAVNAIIQMVELYKGNLTILCLGPLTNLATAVKLKPSIKHMIKECYILGGNHQAVGNTTVLGEFNFVADAEAAHIVLENFCLACPLYVIPWETCVQATSDYSFRVNTLGKIMSKEMTLLNSIEAKILDKVQHEWLAADALAAAILIESAVSKKSESFYCTVELHSPLARGMMIVDKKFNLQRPSNCIILQDIDLALFENMLIWAAGGPHYLSSSMEKKKKTSSKKY